MQDEYFSEDELEYYNNQLTEACRTIFGDIVVKATFSGNHYSRANEYCGDNYPSVRMDDVNTLDWSQEAFSIEFTNGSIVHFTNSEWASLERLDTQTKV